MITRLHKSYGIMVVSQVEAKVGPMSQNLNYPHSLCLSSYSYVHQIKQCTNQMTVLVTMVVIVKSSTAETHILKLKERVFD